MNTKTVYTLGGIIVALGALGLAVFLGMSGEGQIDVNNRIISADQKDFTEEVLPETRAVVPNGGLNPRGDAPLPEPAPAPQPEATTTAEGEGSEASSGTGEAEVPAEGDAPSP